LAEAIINVLDVRGSEEAVSRTPELDPPRRSSRKLRAVSALEARVFVGPARAHRETLDVLVVDDRPDLVAMIVRLVERRGHRVRVATCGVAALDLAREAPAALVLVRDRLSDMDGVDLARLLRGFGVRARMLLLAPRAVAGPPPQQQGSHFEATVCLPIDIELFEALLTGTPGTGPR
jgi:CheY-like chemotaxis protein